MDCACGSFLRRHGENHAAYGGASSSVMDASFVHLPRSLLAVAADDGDDKAALEQQQHHRIHPLHVEFLQSVADQTASSALCLHCVQR